MKLTKTADNNTVKNWLARTWSFKSNLFSLPPKLEHPLIIKSGMQLTWHYINFAWRQQRYCLLLPSLQDSQYTETKTSQMQMKQMLAKLNRHTRSYAFPKNGFLHVLHCVGSSWRQITFLIFTSGSNLWFIKATLPLSYIISTFPPWNRKDQEEKQNYYIYIIYKQQQKWKLSSQSYFLPL